MVKRDSSAEQFRRRLETVIGRHGRTTASFARLAGVDRSTLAQLLDGQEPRLPRADTLIAIAVAARVSTDWLLGLSQREEVGAEIIQAMLQIEQSAEGPVDDQFTAWLKEAEGYRVRTVPVGLPDFVKTEQVLAFEYGASLGGAAGMTEAVRARLDFMVRPDHDVEVCVAEQWLTGFALGQHVWQGLPLDDRVAQLDTLATLYRRAYPGLRLYLYDLRLTFTVPFTVFGPRRAVVFLGPSYLVLNSAEHLRMFSRRFDDLIRRATVQPHEIGGTIDKLLAQARATR